jgi:hypothetical protein
MAFGGEKPRKRRNPVSYYTDYAAEIISRSLWTSTQVVHDFPVLDTRQAAAFIGVAKRRLAKNLGVEKRPAKNPPKKVYTPVYTPEPPKPEDYRLRTPPTVVLSKPLNTNDLAQMIEAEEKSRLQTQLFGLKKRMNELRLKFNQLAYSSEIELKTELARRLETFLANQVKILPENVTVEVNKDLDHHIRSDASSHSRKVSFNVRGVKINTKGLDFHLYLGMEPDLILSGIFGERNPWRELALVKKELDGLIEEADVVESGLKSIEGKQYLVTSFFARKALEGSEEGKRLLETIEEMKVKLREFLAGDHKIPQGEETNGKDARDTPEAV